MASPEVIEPSGALDSTFCEELSAPEGWKKKLMARKMGTPKKKDVVYVAPNGEEIKNKRQLEKYLKVHPGGASLADFDWGTGETPRRSARLISKGRPLSDSMDAEPALKRSKADSDEDVCVVVSPKKPSKRKSGPAVVIAGKDVVMDDAEKGEEGDDTAADDGSDVKPVEEELAAPADETVENNTDEKLVDEKVAVETEEPAEEVPSTGELINVGNSADKVIAEEQVWKVDETVTVTETVTEAITVVKETKVVEHKTETSVEVHVVEDLVKPAEGETSLKEEQEVIPVENQDILDVPAAEKLDGSDVDPLHPKENFESEGIHALVDDPVLSGVAKSPEQQTEPSLPAAERVGVST